MRVFFFFVFFVLSDILKKEQLGFRQIADYLKLEQRKGFSLDMQLEYLADLIVIGQFIMLNDISTILNCINDIF